MSTISTQSGRVTIYDIAGKLGMSHATVSRALRDHPAISLATRERVKRAAGEMNYRPNLIARGLVRGSTATVGLLINGFFVDIAMSKVLALDKIAHGQGYQLFVTNTEGDAKRTLEGARTLIGRGVDGLLVYGLDVPDDDPHLAELAELPVPAVFFDLPLTARCRQVVLDRSVGIAAAIDALIDLGHRDVCMICTDAGRWQHDHRLMGFLDACRRHQLTAPRSRLFETGIERWNPVLGRRSVDADVVRQCVGRLLHAYPGCTAIICNNDLIATIVLGGLADHELRVPDDISLVGFDDIASAAYLRPSLSTVAQPVEEVAQATWQMLREAMSDPKSAPQTVTVSTRFVRRDSIGKARGVQDGAERQAP